MIYIRTGLALALCGGLAACGGGTARLETASASSAKTDWHAIATAQDRSRLRDWRQAWTAALDKVRAAGKGKALAAQGALFEPDHALADPTPPPGAYRCRWFKLGAKGTAMAEFTAYPDFRCRIDDEGEVDSFYKEDGSQRPVGLVFGDGARAIFLGTLVLGDETKPMQYGRDADRDMAGYIDRVGAKRWRLVLPYPKFESILDVIELVPEHAAAS